MLRPRVISRLLFAAALGVGAWRIAADVSDSGVYTIGTFAGSDWVGDGGPAIQAILLQAEGVAIDPQRNLYIADALGHRVRQVTPAGVIRTVAGTGVRGFSGDGGSATAARLNAPYGIAVDRSGNLYICDLGNARVRRVGIDGTITTVLAGPLIAPRNVAVDDSSGDLLIADFDGHRVYRLRPGSGLAVEAGAGSSGYSGDGGSATAAQLSYPAGLAVDKTGAVYIGDTQNHAVRRVSGKVITTVARANAPTGLAIDAAGTLHIADAGSGQILRVTVSGTSSLPVGARDVAVDLDGTIFAPDQGVVRRRQASGIVTVVAGGGSLAYGDRGDAVSARLSQPSGVAFAGGSLYIADRGNHRVRRVGADGTITTIAGTGVAGSSGDGGLATQAALNQPSAVSVDMAGNVYITDSGNGRVRRVSATGQIVAVASTPAPTFAIADASGALYVSDSSMGAILKVNGGIVTTLARGLKDPRGLALDGGGSLYFTEAGAARVGRIAPDLTVVDIAPGAWKIPRGIAVDDRGNVFVADTARHSIVRVDARGAAVIAGTGTPGFSGDGDAAFGADLGFPWDVTVGAEGKLFVADLDNNRIRVLMPAIAAVPSEIRQTDAVNAASMRAGPIVPGMLVALVGTGLRPADIPETVFLFGSMAGEFMAIEQNRVLVRAPAELAASGNIAIDVRIKGISRAVIPAVLAESAPALFTDASGIAGSAERGGIVSLYGTGSGVGLNATVTIGGATAEVLYAGAAGNYPGVFQINARMPEGVLGSSEVVVKFGSASSAPAMVVVR